MKNLTLAVKITIGFATLLLIAAILGGMAVVSMSGVEKDSRKLSDIYVPEVEVGNNVERWSLLTRFEVLGYILSEEARYLNDGRANMEKVYTYLDEAKALAKKYDLPALTGLEAKARTNLQTYKGLVDQAEGLTWRARTRLWTMRSHPALPQPSSSSATTRSSGSTTLSTWGTTSG